MKNDCFLPAKILLPKNCDYEKWAVIACDQFTSDLEYWETLREFIGDGKSTLNLVLPEIFLDENAEDFVKLNFDGSVKQNGLASGGFVVRNHLGSILDMDGLLFGTQTPIMSEALSLRARVKRCKNLGFRNVIIEGDSKIIID